MNKPPVPVPITSVHSCLLEGVVDVMWGTICTPNSLSQEVGLGLGAQAGEDRLGQVVAEAGFTRFRRAAATPLNLILEVRP